MAEELENSDKFATRGVHEKLPAGFERVAVDQDVFIVHQHPFWKQYGRKWEPETWRFYERFCKPNAIVLDIGSWIGPTVLIAATRGASKIVAVEANPETALQLGATKKMNIERLSNLSIINAVIDNRDGVVDFGGPRGSRAASSASSTRGSGFKVPTTTIQSVILDHLERQPDLVKVDIEGSEVDVSNQWSQIRSPMLLSLHPPFWKDRDLAACADKIIDALSYFNLQKVDETPLCDRELQSMLVSTEPLPSWGTQYGNFFEIVAIPKQ